MWDEEISEYPNAFDLIIKYPILKNLQYVCLNTNPKAITLLENNEDDID